MPGRLRHCLRKCLRCLRWRSLFRHPYMLPCGADNPLAGEGVEHAIDLCPRPFFLRVGLALFDKTARNTVSFEHVAGDGELARWDTVSPLGGLTRLADCRADDVKEAFLLAGQ